VSDTSQGPGWWQASDGKWYPPEQAPGYQAPAGGGADGGAGGGGAGTGTLDFGAAFSWSWKQFTENIGPWITIAVGVAVVYLVFFGLALVINSLILSLVLRVIGYIVGAMIALGLIRAALASTAGRKPEVSMLFETDHLGDYILASILFGILFTIGFVVCCVGEIAVAVFLAFYGFYIVDRGEKATGSLTSSFNLVKDNLGTCFVLLLVAWLLLVVGYITCGIALVVTGPLAYLLMAYGFKSLNGESIAA
jgi:uncharacterized membrane protein